jgi:hypothetical protein
MFVRPSRSATVRTRLGREEIHERLAALVAHPPPDGTSAFFAHGYILGGSVSPRDFHLDYQFNSARNPQTYSVQGTVEDTPEWRILRLKLTAQDPWVSKWEVGALLLVLGFSIYGRDVPPGGAVAAALVVVALYVAANLFYVPDMATSRVASLVADQVQGSVRQGSQWVVPEGPDVRIRQPPRSPS